MATPKGDESTRFLHTLQELKNNAEPENGDFGSDTAYSSLSSAASLSFASPPIRWNIYFYLIFNLIFSKLNINCYQMSRRYNDFKVNT